MPLVFSVPSILPVFHKNQDNFCISKFNRSFNFFHHNVRWSFLSLTKNVLGSFSHNPVGTIRSVATKQCRSNNQISLEESSFVDDLDCLHNVGSPWEYAVVYKRNTSISHLEYCTTLERLGLGKLSTEISRSCASVMGLRVTKVVKDFPLGTPVLISLDVTRKKQKLRLDGIIRTVITVVCNRCGKPAAETVFSNFSLLLTEKPVGESNSMDMGVILGQNKFKSSGSNEEEEDNEDASIDVDDWLYFPPEEKSIDISKHIRDLVHLEITINALCDPACKGVCLKCGTNLNSSSCSCSKQKVIQEKNGPLGNLRKQMQ